MRFLKTTVVALTAVASVATAQHALADETVKFWTFREQEAPLWERINAEGLIPGVTVEMERISSDDYESRLRIAMQQGGPDIFAAKAGAAWLETYLQTDVLESISSLGIDVSGMNGVTAVTGSDGKIYGVPGSIQLQSVIYNEASLEELDMGVPETLEEFEALMAAALENDYVGLHVAGRAGWYLNQVMNETLMAGFVSDATQQGLIDGTKCFTDAEVVGALESFTSWAPYFNPNPTSDNYEAMRTAVAQGDSVAMVDGAWSTGPTSPMYEINEDFVPVFGPLPGANGKVVAYADGGYSVNAGTEKMESVKKVLEFMTTAKFAAIFAEEVTEVPAYAGSFPVENERLAKIVEELQNAAAVVPIQAFSLNKGQPSYSALSMEVYQSMLAGKMTPVEAAAHIQEGLNSWNYVGTNNCK